MFIEEKHTDYSTDSRRGYRPQTKGSNPVRATNTYGEFSCWPITI